MRLTVLRMTLGLIIMVAAAQQVFARPGTCAPRPDVIERLAATYGETRKGIGIARQGAVMEIYASDETGSWTIIVTLPDGMACLVAAGQSYEALADALPPKGDKI